MRSRLARTTVAALAGAALALTLTAPVGTAAPAPKKTVSGKFQTVAPGGTECPEPAGVALLFSGDMEGCWYITGFDDTNTVVDQQGNGVWKADGRIVSDTFIGTVHGEAVEMTFTGVAYAAFRGGLPPSGVQITGGCTHDINPGQSWEGTVYLKDLFGQGNLGDGRYHGKITPSA